MEVVMCGLRVSFIVLRKIVNFLFRKWTKGSLKEPFIKRKAAKKCKMSMNFLKDRSFLAIKQGHVNDLLRDGENYEKGLSIFIKAYKNNAYEEVE